MESTVNKKQVTMLNIEEVLPNRFQPRIKFDEQALNELTNSVKTHGIIQPIIVRPLGDKYEIIAGERRYKASTLAGLTEIPSIIVDMNDKESAEVALMENVQRQDLTPIEEAISYKKILDMGYIKQDELAGKLGKNQSTVANKLRLLNLSDEVQEALLQGKISERHARSLLKLKDNSKQNKLLNRIIEERLTVRRTDEEIEKMIENKDVEVLDFDFSNSGIKTEDIESPLDKYEGLYNIPSAPIVEDKEDEVLPVIPDIEAPKSAFEGEKLSIPKTEEVNASLNHEDIKPITNEVNPGFMDINKIENQATNINEEPKKISLEDLLRSPDTTVNNQTTPTPNQEIKEAKEDVEVPSFNTGRFFTMTEDEEEKPSFEPKFGVEEPKIVPTNNSDIDNIDKIKEEEKAEDNFSKFEFPTLEEVKPVTSIPVEPKEEMTDFNNFDFNVPSPTVEQDNLENTITINPVPLEENNLSNFKMPPLDDNYVEPKVEEYKPIYDEPERDIEKPIDNNKYGAADLRMVINTIRECANTIEKYGYVIDTEEFDFEDMYQVIFKVQKKN